jgi:proteasome lid subunit RPN8/RPN11
MAKSTNMDNDIQFGDLQRDVPQTSLRPDQNRHFASLPLGAPQNQDLAIFVDLDVMREVEMHAASDTSVELGGVLLGGQFLDHTGRPFVVITDCLRAEHYEATRGSFKFTHQTWAEITRQREQFPSDLQMVGWYHTHPDWGVFLSGMDDFICQNFFDGDLDVALVIDPCRQERAFFQWDRQTPPQTRRTHGFTMISSRFRLPELEVFAAQLEGRTTMPGDPRYMPWAAGQAAPSGAANVQSVWLPIAILGSLTMQFLLVALLAWHLLAAPQPAVTEAVSASQQRQAGEREMLERIIQRIDVVPDNLVGVMTEQHEENESLTAANLGLLAQVRELQRAVELEEQRRQSLSGEARDLRRALEIANQDKTRQGDEIKSLNSQLAALNNDDISAQDDSEEDEDIASLWKRVSPWKWYLGIGLVVIATLAAITAFVFSSSTKPGSSPEDVGDHPSES